MHGRTTFQSPLRRLAAGTALAAILPASAALAQGPANVARYGLASQSSTAHNGFAARAIDGNPDGVWTNSSVTHTDSLPDSWWEVDLGGPRVLEEIVLHNRADCCWDRLSNFRVSVHDGVGEVFGQDFFTASGGVGQGASLSVPLPAGTLGERVRVKILGLNLSGTGHLSLAEVEVMGDPVQGTRNLARVGAAAQSTTHSFGFANHAIDGNADGDWLNGSVTHTDQTSPDNWWEVILADRSLIDEVVLHNRNDCCWDRLSNFRLSIFDGATEVFGQDYFTASGSVGQGAAFPVPMAPGLMGERVRVQFLGFNGTGNGALSLAEVEVIGSDLSLVYCTGKLNSQGCTPAIAYGGAPSVSNPGPFDISASDLINNKTAMFFYGLSGRHNLAFQRGVLCALPPLKRTMMQSTGGNPPPADCSGTAAIDFNQWMQKGHGANLLPVGTQVFGQFWYTDPVDPTGVGLSDAIEFSVGP